MGGDPWAAFPLDARAPRMRCGWGCGAQLTGRNMRAHFSIYPKSAAVALGLGFGTELTGRQMHAHFATCANKR
jgi:hypothetical protein